VKSSSWSSASGRTLGGDSGGGGVGGSGNDDVEGSGERDELIDRRERARQAALKRFEANK